MWLGVHDAYPTPLGVAARARKCTLCLCLTRARAARSSGCGLLQHRQHSLGGDAHRREGGGRVACDWNAMMEMIFVVVAD